ncbi:MAG: leucine-rich repeat domain-containing protein, partial [Paludibacteraceae bacterium]|nr:leucine-rich repeat domain-containing protein [Paludibacteraceae bacterium]
SISVPNTVTIIGGGAFGQCSFVERVDMPNVNIIESGAFSNCIDLKSVNMPKVTAIAEDAFNSCYRVDSIDIPNVTILESFAFAFCENLKSINIPNVTKIGRRAFYSCSDLQKVVLGNVDSIKSEAFAGCRSLDTFRIITAMPPVLGNSVFTDTPSDVLIQVPCGASSLYEQVEVWKNYKNYEEVAPKVTVMSNDEKMGVVILDRQATCENPTAEIEAMPRSGYEFVKWSDENTENPRVVAVEDEDITLTAIFQKVGTDVENVGIEGMTIYSDGTVLHVEGAEKEYQIYSTTGSLLYRGTDAEVALPRGIYVVRYGNAIEKVVL